MGCIRRGARFDALGSAPAVFVMLLLLLLILLLLMLLLLLILLLLILLLQLLVQALLMGGVRYQLPEGAAPVINLHKASALIALGRYQQASTAASR